MHSLLNRKRPPLFCPGCSHERIVKVLDRAFVNMNLQGSQIVIVTDIGCSGLFDTFFNTHAMHGLHGRALTYATGLKLARPDLNVIVTMGDGGLGIGGAHLLASCRRNLDITLLVMNNFNFGMTGGQFSATTPFAAHVGSGFLNRMERPLDICQTAVSAGAAYVSRCSSYDKDLVQELINAISFEGFSIVDIWGICPGRYTKKNILSPKSIKKDLDGLPAFKGVVPENIRKEYGKHYRKLAGDLRQVAPPENIEAKFTPPQPGRNDVVILGSAGQRIITAGEILCLAAMTGGLKATQKNEYNITVLRGPSISELILSQYDINFTGIKQPSAILALSNEGVESRKNLFNNLNKNTLIIRAHNVKLQASSARIVTIDFKKQKIKSQDRAMASLAVLAKLNIIINYDMLESALKYRFRSQTLNTAMDIIQRVKLKWQPSDGNY